jgi:nicotine blue oxidoreductase
MMMIRVGTCAPFDDRPEDHTGPFPKPSTSRSIHARRRPPPRRRKSWSNSPVRIAAIVLAAGEGRRMGGPKALLPFGLGTFLSHLCRVFARAGCSDVIAVLGAEADRVLREAGPLEGAVATVNPRWREGMLSSVWRGLDEAEARGAEAVLLHPVDHPLVEPATIGLVLDALRGGATVAVPAVDGRRGHPGGFAREVFGELRAAPPDRGARAVLDADPGRVVHVPGDAGCRAGIDTPDDYRARLGRRP